MTDVRTLQTPVTQLRIREDVARSVYPTKRQFQRFLRFCTDSTHSLGGDGCNVWNGSVRISKSKNYQSGGIPVMYIARTRRDVPRLSYTWFVGSLARGQVLIHTCGVSLCVNPMHIVVKGGIVSDDEEEEEEEEEDDLYAQSDDGDGSETQLTSMSIVGGGGENSHHHHEENGDPYYSLRHPEFNLRTESTKRGGGGGDVCSYNFDFRCAKIPLHQRKQLYELSLVVQTHGMEKLLADLKMNSCSLLEQYNKVIAWASRQYSEIPQRLEEHKRELERRRIEDERNLRNLRQFLNP